jgi:ribulose-5-phosphate 4-epimerase/fuculose-1-phosphate aldolase
MTDQHARDGLVDLGRSLFERGYGAGTSGNLSVRLEAGGYLMTPTNVSLGRLASDALSRLDSSGQPVEGPPPTKEAWLHLAMYRSRPAAGAIVHLHSTYGVALSALNGRDAEDMLPPITPYAVMRLGRVALVPYFRPGDVSAADAIARRAVDHHVLLLANHGPVVAGADLASAGAIAEELEETARLVFVLAGHDHRLLSAAQVEDLRRVFEP